MNVKDAEETIGASMKGNRVAQRAEKEATKDLHRLRHSAAHVLAQALKRLWR